MIRVFLSWSVAKARALYRPRPRRSLLSSSDPGGDPLRFRRGRDAARGRRMDGMYRRRPERRSARGVGTAVQRRRLQRARPARRRRDLPARGHRSDERERRRTQAPRRVSQEHRPVERHRVRALLREMPREVRPANLGRYVCAEIAYGVGVLCPDDPAGHCPKGEVCCGDGTGCKAAIHCAGTPFWRCELSGTTQCQGSSDDNPDADHPGCDQGQHCQPITVRTTRDALIVLGYWILQRRRLKSMIDAH